MQTEPTKAGERTQDEQDGTETRLLPNRTKEEQRTQHTPGPWKIRKRKGKFTQVYILDAANKGAIAEISPFGNVENCLRHEANARLIAAAPELLEALRECITSEEAACLSDMENHPEWMQRRLYAISDLARAAVAKAEGERK